MIRLSTNRKQTNSDHFRLVSCVNKLFANSIIPAAGSEVVAIFHLEETAGFSFFITTPAGVMSASTESSSTPRPPFWPPWRPWPPRPRPRGCPLLYRLLLFLRKCFSILSSSHFGSAASRNCGREENCWVLTNVSSISLNISICLEGNVIDFVSTRMQTNKARPLLPNANMLETLPMVRYVVL